MNPTEGQQERVLRTFTALYSLRPNWGGSLIVGPGLAPEGAALAMAANIAGAVCLSVEDDPVHIKEAIRSGSVDFVVNTLDEALRTMKNEIRKHLPLSVGLRADAAAVFDEMFERGVSPDVFAALSGTDAASGIVARFAAAGAAILVFEGDDAGPNSISVEARVKTVVLQRRWELQSFTFETSSALRAFDAEALTLVSDQDQLRSIWLRAAPRILRRERPWRRVLWLTAEEEKTLRLVMP